MGVERKNDLYFRFSDKRRDSRLKRSNMYKHYTNEEVDKVLSEFPYGSLQKFQLKDAMCQNVNISSFANIKYPDYIMDAAKNLFLLGKTLEEVKPILNSKFSEVQINILEEAIKKRKDISGIANPDIPYKEMQKYING